MDRPEARKVLIILSDGQPSVCAGQSAMDSKSQRQAPHQFLVNVVAELRKDTEIDLYAIGIQSAGTQKFYGTQAKNVNDLADLNAVLLGTLRDALVD